MVSPFLSLSPSLFVFSLDSPRQCICRQKVPHRQRERERKRAINKRSSLIVLIVPQTSHINRTVCRSSKQTHSPTHVHLERASFSLPIVYENDFLTFWLRLEVVAMGTLISMNIPRSKLPRIGITSWGHFHRRLCDFFDECFFPLYQQFIDSKHFFFLSLWKNRRTLNFITPMTDYFSRMKLWVSHTRDSISFQNENRPFLLFDFFNSFLWWKLSSALSESDNSDNIYNWRNSLNLLQALSHKFVRFMCVRMCRFEDQKMSVLYNVIVFAEDLQELIPIKHLWVKTAQSSRNFNQPDFFTAFDLGTTPLGFFLSEPQSSRKKCKIEEGDDFSLKTLSKWLYPEFFELFSQNFAPGTDFFDDLKNKWKI